MGLQYYDSILLKMSCILFFFTSVDNLISLDFRYSSLFFCANGRCQWKRKGRNLANHFLNPYACKIKFLIDAKRHFKILVFMIGKTYVI